MAIIRYFRLFSKKTICGFCGLFAVLMILIKLKGFTMKENMISNDYLFTGGTAKLEKISKVKDVRNRSTSREITLSENNNIVIILKNTNTNPNLQSRFEILIQSMSRKSSIPLCFHIICDVDGKTGANSTIRRYAPKGTKIIFHDVFDVTRKVGEQITQMQNFFSHSAKGYYGDPLFFLSIVLHRVIPLDKVIMLDVDLKFDEDIKDLFEIFSEFSEGNIIGIARENQPVYRHLFHQYRGKNPSTRVGAPPPNGLTGFNSGVLLLNLEKMRESNAYNSLIDSPKTLERLTQKYLFKGHLGDQDFYTLVSLEDEALFYILPCSWNRQLCVWWRDNGYSQVFDQYYTCSEKVKIYHGNCNSKIPTLSWENEI
ncbi:xyloside xylosyltransferase 1-like [Saccostrea echinata]|uniref:xyloside xylosyltransferase 1-like n=1 Tax=Saccostrea echinata TaxID=191078 RepID=UPI002A8359A1|nr:xyloside xylosyltransferase 1-like [Saccostrea echinata]